MISKVSLRLRDCGLSVRAVWSNWTKECVRLLVIGSNPRTDISVLMKLVHIELDPLVYLPGPLVHAIFPVCYDLQMDSGPRVSPFRINLFRKVAGRSRSRVTGAAQPLTHIVLRERSYRSLLIQMIIAADIRLTYVT
jgi:hypothetical protein